MKKIILLFLLLGFIIGGSGGCSPKNFVPYEPPEVKFEPTQPYELDLSQFKKLDHPVMIILDKDFKPVEKTGKEEKYIVFTKEEFKKILALNELEKLEITTIKSQVNIINTKIDEINALKELVAIKEEMIKQYIALYTSSENAYRQERYQHKWDNTQNKIVQVLMLGGFILLLL